jgi:hypothetical protein
MTRPCRRKLNPRQVAFYARNDAAYAWMQADLCREKGQHAEAKALHAKAEAFMARAAIADGEEAERKQRLASANRSRS